MLFGLRGAICRASLKLAKSDHLAIVLASSRTFNMGFWGQALSQTAVNFCMG